MLCSVSSDRRFSNDLRKTTAKLITPINHNESKQRNEETNENSLKLIACSKRGEKSRVQGAIGFDFVSHWLKNWRKIFTPISKRINRNCLITFDSLL